MTLVPTAHSTCLIFAVLASNIKLYFSTKDEDNQAILYDLAAAVFLRFNGTENEDQTAVILFVGFDISHQTAKHPVAAGIDHAVDGLLLMAEIPHLVYFWSGRSADSHGYFKKPDAAQ